MERKKQEEQEEQEEQKEKSTNAFTFLAYNGVAEMGKQRTMRLIRIRKEDWDTVERFSRKPTIVTLRKVDLPD